MSSERDGIQREVLPIPDRHYEGRITYDAKDYVDGDKVGEGWVQVDVDEAAENVNHLISPDELLRVAMARQ